MKRWIPLLMILALIENASASFWPLGKALQKVLGTPKASKTDLNVNGENVEVFYPTDKKGKTPYVGVVAKGLYPPNCTHTWVIAVDKKKATVASIYAVEMSCPHAHPTNTPSFLTQYKGVGPAELAALDGKISTVAKATGTSQLTTDAVKRAVTAVKKLQGKL